MRDGWKEISLEDLETSGVIKLGRGDVISKKDMEADPGSNPVYSSAENKNGMIGKYAKFMFDEELITWSVDGGGHIFYRPKHKFSVTNIGGWLRILDNKVFSYQFLTYALQRLHKQHSFDWQHKAHPSVIRKLYTRIPLPSLPEQKRIVDLISSVDSYIEALQQQLVSAKRSRNAVLHELLTAGGEDWTGTNLGEVAEVLSGFAFKSDLFSESEGMPLIRIRDLPKRNITEAFYSGDYEDRYVVRKGDFLIGMDGQFHCYEWTGADALLNQRVCRIQGFKFDRVLPRFIYFSVNQHLEKIEQDTGYTTVKHIAGKQILGIQIALPPLPEQQRIVEIINTIDEVIDQTEITTKNARDLRSGLLSDLLSGEHEIPSTYDKVMGAA